MAILEHLPADYPSPPEHLDTLSRYLMDLGTLHADLGSETADRAAFRQARSYYERAARIQTRLAADFPSIPQYRYGLALAQYNLGNTLMHLGDWQAARASLERSVDNWERLAADVRKVAEYRMYLGRACNNLGNQFALQGDWDAARPWLVKALHLKEKLADEFPTVTAYRDDLARSCINVSFVVAKSPRPAEVEPLLRDCLAVAERKIPEQWAWLAYDIRSRLGGSLLGQKKYADAEPLLRDGYAGMKERAAQIPSSAKTDLTEALERLVRLYDATGQKDKADRWRSELDKAKAAARKPKP
jgi:tetratricopeptide (TPR) repeat protein